MKSLLALLAITWTGFWLTPDQQGRRHFERGEYVEAAKDFQDPMWQGVAWFRSGDFKRAAAVFSRQETPQAAFNMGDALIMLGSYDAAISAFSKSLEMHPGWKEAQENLALAQARAALTAEKGGDLGDQREGADEIVFDRNQEDNSGQDTEVTEEQALGADQIQSLWLRRVTTNPADFLKAKFSYQYQTTQAEDAE